MDIVCKLTDYQARSTGTWMDIQCDLEELADSDLKWELESKGAAVEDGVVKFTISTSGNIAPF